MREHQKDYLQTCFLCNTETGDITREHFVPRWLIRLLESASIKVSDRILGNTRINYHTYQIPCCRSCNSTLGRELESPIAGAWHTKGSLRDIPDRTLVRWLLKMHWGIQYRDHSPALSRRSRVEDEKKWAHVSQYVPANRISMSNRILGGDPAWEAESLVLRAVDFPTSGNYILLPNHDAFLLIFPGHLIIASFTPCSAIGYLRFGPHASYEQYFAGFVAFRVFGQNEDEHCPACALELHGPAIMSNLYDMLPEATGWRPVLDKIPSMKGLLLLPSNTCRRCNGRPNAVYEGKRVYLDSKNPLVKAKNTNLLRDPWAVT